jgi:hypothetical protein
MQADLIKNNMRVAQNDDNFGEGFFDWIQEDPIRWVQKFMGYLVNILGYTNISDLSFGDKRMLIVGFKDAGITDREIIIKTFLAEVYSVYKDPSIFKGDKNG